MSDRWTVEILTYCAFTLFGALVTSVYHYADEPENKLEVVALNTGVCSNCKATTQVIIRERKGDKYGH